MKKLKLPTINLIRKGVLLSCISLAAPLSAQAATLQDLVNAINDFQEGALDVVEGAIKSYLGLLFEENPTYPATLAGNTALNNDVKTKVQDSINEQAFSQIKEALTRQNEDKQSIILSSLPASDNQTQTSSSSSTNNPAPVSGGANQKEETKAPAGDLNFDVGSLLSKLSYADDDAKKNAQNYIQFITSLADPVSTVNMTTLTAEQRRLLQSSTVGRYYVRYVRSVVAARSMAVNNLLRMYAERLPQEGLGKQAGMKEANASPLEVRAWLATRRTDNQGDWYQNMATASDSTVQRETLNVLAEIQRQNYEAQMQNERILATLSVMVLQNIQANKTADQAKEAQIGKLLKE